jgi:hypothetical protein
VIGDIRPINTLPKVAGFLINIVSRSQGNSNRKSRKIRLQYIVIKISNGIIADFARRGVFESILNTKRILKAIKTTADESGIGINFIEKDVNPIFPDNQPNKLSPVIKMTRNKSESFLLITCINFDLIMGIILATY